MVDNGRSVEVKIAWSTGRGRVMAGKGLAEILDSRRRHEGGARSYISSASEYHGTLMSWYRR
eukprot:scaffold41798_cov372-Skeletonema_dohrnii-CCMP3373.AAC.1